METGDAKTARPQKFVLVFYDPEAYSDWPWQE
jgi:hypothetical protein